MVEHKINPVGETLSRFGMILGAKGIITDPDVIAPWLRDWRGLYQGKAAAILAPENTDQTARCVALAAELGVPLVPQGGNTSMVGGATPPDDGSALIFSTRRMNRIRSVDASAGIAVAEAGVILEALHESLASTGRRFPLSLAAKGSATVGGLVSTNAGGTQVLRFGTMRNLVLGLEAVLPDGSIHNGLSVLRKDTRGYDLNQLLIGAEGTLGIVTAASLKLVAEAGSRAVAWIGLDSPDRALELLRFMEVRSGDSVESFELIPAHSLEAVLRHIAGTRAPLESTHQWHVLVEYVAGDDAAESLAALLASALESGLCDDATIASNEAQALAFWRLRETVSEAERADGPAIQHDISVPVDSMPAFMESASRAIELEFPGVATTAFGHLGDGNVHFHVRAPKGVDAAAWRAGQGKAASRRVHDLVVAANGSISAEHGIGQMKRVELLRLSDPMRIAALRAIKQALDVKGIMNPGKLVPLASDR